MSVVIRGMKMPTSCDECPCFSEYDACDVTGSWKFADEFDKGKDRLPDCPLVPVPDHGDLIDRDKLEKDIDKYIGGEESRSRFHHWVQVQDAVIHMDKGEEK